jgi:beta-glucanase (GH16 family)
MKWRTLIVALAALMGPSLRAQSATPVLVWSDEFNQAAGTQPDPAKWGYDLGVGDPPGWGNNELETYTSSPSNVLVVSDPSATDGRALAIRAQDASGSYTSARIKTQATFSFTYGRMEARARVPAGVGCWPAFWAVGSNITTAGWPACGEIDIMEWVGQTPSHIKGSLHASGYSGGQSLNADCVLPGNASYSDAYHVFAVDWYPDQVVFSMDGAVYEVRKMSGIPAGSQWPFDLPFFIILNFAVGGDWPGPPNSSTVFPQDFRIDYVRVYSLPATPPASLVWAPGPPTNILAYSPGASQVSVSWQAPLSTFGAALSGYALERASDPAFTQNLTTWNLGGSTSYLDTTARAGATYYYRVSAVSANGTSVPSGAAQTAALASPGSSKLSNISTRGFVGTGSSGLIAGFVVDGSSPKMVLVRASGPAIAAAPFNVPGTLPDPLLQVYSGSAVIASNRGWGGNAPVAAAAAEVGAFAWSDPASGDSALLMTLSPGAYTAIVSGASGDTGVSLVEVYDVQSPGSSKLSNISTRGFVGTGAGGLIAGFVVDGSGPKTVLVRASGPAIAAAPFNVPGTLPDPLLQIYSGSTVIAGNQGWGGSGPIAAAAAEVGAFAWSDPSSNDAALLMTLSPGAYTAIVSGAGGDTGVSLVEVYDVE